VNDGQSALGFARRENHPTIVDFLRTRGAIDDEIDDEEENDDDE
jgi:hypothetical protein